MLKNERGMTLIEMLAVIAIISILMVVITPNVNKLYSNAKIDNAGDDLREFNAIAKKYFQDAKNGTFNEEELEEYTGYKVTSQYVGGGTYKKYTLDTKKDPWGQEYTIYINTLGTKYVMMHSNGPNKAKDINLTQNKTGDDIFFVYYPEN